MAETLIHSMRGVGRRALTLATVAVAACSQGNAQSGADATNTVASQVSFQSANVLAFEHVDVLPMDSERILSDQTVVVRDGRIAAMGSSSEVEIPEGALRIEGNGRTLLPGLAEMHAHVPGDDAPRDLMEDILFLYIANGITTIRGMLGAPGQLGIRAELAAGELLGPNMIVGAPSLNGNSAPNAETAERLVRTYKEQGYDFLKIHPGVPRDAWDRMVEVAGEVGITYAGHVPQDVGIEHALMTNIGTVDHLDGYLQGALPTEMTERLSGNLGVIPTAEILAGVDWTRVAEFVELTVEQGVWNVPTLYLWENFYAPIDVDSVMALPEMRYVPSRMREGWASAKRRRGAETAEVAREVAESRLRLLSMLEQAGAGILMGTDSPQMFNVPGFALHHELLIMGRVMSPYSVLASGTRNVAEYAGSSLGLDDEFGVVAVGKRADLILVDGNPLESLEAISNLAGVMVRGRWVSNADIESGLARLDSKYNN